MCRQADAGQLTLDRVSLKHTGLKGFDVGTKGESARQGRLAFTGANVIANDNAMLAVA